MAHKKLIDLLDLKNNSVLSVVGSGGKTSFCEKISFELFQKFGISKSILFSTTTKIKDFENPIYKKIIHKSENDISLNSYFNLKGLCVTGIKKETKIMSLPLEKLKYILEIFDYSVLEADGSKRKPIKAWNDTEPVYVKNTTHTIAIIPIKAIGLFINNINIHRLEIFQKNFNKRKKEKIDIELLKEIILNENGLFKNSLGEKILFINQVETKSDLENVILLINLLKKEKEKFIDKIIYGSLHNDEYNIF